MDNLFASLIEAIVIHDVIDPEKLLPAIAPLPICLLVGFHLAQPIVFFRDAGR